MKIDFDQQLRDLDGTVIPDQATNEPFTMKLACLRALTTPLPEDQNMTGETAFKRLELARKVNSGGEQDIGPEDAVLIRERAAKIYSIQISGQVYEKLR